MIILPHAKVFGINDRPNQGDRSFPTVDLATGLASSWPTDAHTTSYSEVLIDNKPAPHGYRVNLPALEHGVSLRFGHVLLDVDTPGHAEATPDWWQGQVRRLPGALKDQTSWYATKHGIRFVWQLPEPVGQAGFHTVRDAIVQLLEASGIEVDHQAMSLNNLYRLPRVVRAGEELALPSDLTNLKPISMAKVVLAAAVEGTTVIKGKRNSELTSLAGRLRAGGADEESILASLVDFNKQRCKPPLPSSDLATIAHSVSRYTPRLDEDKPTITLAPGQLDKTVDAAAVRVSSLASIYHRGGVAVHLQKNGQIGTLNADHVRYYMAKVANWQRLKDKGPQVCDPPKDLASMTLQQIPAAARDLKQLSQTPMVTPEGEIVLEGYHDGTLLVDHMELPPVPLSEALDLLNDVLADFPFPSPVEHAAAMAALVTATLRTSIDGLVPLFLVNSSVRGSGKGLFTDVCSILATGHPAPKSPQRRTEEMEKFVTAALMSGQMLFVIDNIERPLGDEVLDSLVTSDVWQGRILGHSQQVQVSNRTLWFATGNNIIVKGDLARRVLRVHMQPDVEKPELRDGWRHENLLAYVQANRARLVSAVVTLVTSYLKAPGPGPKLRPFGLFGQWERFVRQPLVWAGMADPVSSQVNVHDETSNAAKDLVAYLSDQHGADPFLVRDVVQEAITSQQLQEIMVTLVGDTRKVNTLYVSRVFARYRDRIFAGQSLAYGKRTKLGRQWIIKNKG